MLHDLGVLGVSAFVLWLLVSGIPAILCIPLARGKGRDVAVWFVLGVLGGWIVFLLLAVLPVQFTPRRRRALGRRHHR